MAGIEPHQKVVDSCKSFAKESNKNKFIVLTIGYDEDGMEELQVWKNDTGVGTAGTQWDHYGGHELKGAKQQAHIEKGRKPFKQECEEHKISEDNYTSQQFFKDNVPSQNVGGESALVDAAMAWDLLKEKIRGTDPDKVGKEGKYAFIKIPFLKGGTWKKGIAFAMHAGTKKRKPGKVAFAMTKPTCKGLIPNVNASTDTPLDQSFEDMYNKFLRV